VQSPAFKWVFVVRVSRFLSCVVIYAPFDPPAARSREKSFARDPVFLLDSAGFPFFCAVCLFAIFFCVAFRDSDPARSGVPWSVAGPRRLFGVPPPGISFGFGFGSFIPFSSQCASTLDGGQWACFSYLAPLLIDLATGSF